MSNKDKGVLCSLRLCFWSRFFFLLRRSDAFNYEECSTQGKLNSKMQSFEQRLTPRCLHFRNLQFDLTLIIVYTRIWNFIVSPILQSKIQRNVHRQMRNYWHIVTIKRKCPMASTLKRWNICIEHCDIDVRTIQTTNIFIAYH